MTRSTPTSTTRKQCLEFVALGTALLMYLIIGTMDLHLPGPQNDEVADAVPAMELLRGIPSSAFDNIELLGFKLPLMMGHYTGPTSIYASYLAMTVFGISIEGLRAGQLLLGSLSIIVLWVLARRWFGVGVAGIAALLCASFPPFIWWNRSGAHFAAPLVPLALLLLLLLHAWWRTRKPKWLITSAFVFGVGLTTKLLFAWLLIPIAITGVMVIGIPGIYKIIRSIVLRIYVVCLAALLVGMFPFILHNLPSGASFRFIGENALQSRAYAHNNLDVIGNIKFETLDFLRMMSGDTLHFDAPTPFPLGAMVIVICAVYTLVLVFRKRRMLSIQHDGIDAIPASIRTRLFLLMLIVTVIPLGTVSISGIGARHLFIITPLVWLLIAACIYDLYLAIAKHLCAGTAIGITGAVILGIVGNQLVTNANVHAFLSRTGGKGLWSNSLYTLAAELQTTYFDRPLIAMDWGFERSIAFLSQDRIRVREMYEYLPEPSPRFLDLATVLVREPANLYIFHTPQSTQFKGYLEAMRRAADIQHKQLNALKTLYEQDGTPSIILYSAETTPRSFVVSPTLATRNAVYDGGLVLLGGTSDYDAAHHEVAVQLYWQSTAQTQPDDVVLVHIVNQDTGDVIVAADTQPVYGSYPFSAWQKYEVVTDPHWISLPQDITPGTYQVRIGVYARNSGVRRAISDPLNDAAGNSLMLNWFVIK